MARKQDDAKWDSLYGLFKVSILILSLYFYLYISIRTFQQAINAEVSIFPQVYDDLRNYILFLKF